MKKEFVPYEEALALKELGFNEPCFGHYLMKEFYLKEYHKQGNGITLTPLYQQAFRWFRESHGLYSNLSSWTHEKDLGIYHDYEIYDISSCQHVSDKFKSYEEAELACLKQLIEIIKNK
jgi:hypothetical protein